jgi:uncharacterized protein YjiS (DUF1127 family)
MIALPRLPRATIDNSRPGWRPLLGLIDTLQLWTERHRQRQALLALSDHMLKDIGLTHADVYRESMKPFWRC